MLTQDFPPVLGGIQTYALELARRFARRGHAVQVVCPHAGDTRALDAALGFVVHRVRAGGDALPLAMAPLLTRLVLQQRIDVLFHVQWQTAPLGALLRRAGLVDKLAIAVHGKELLLRPLGHVAPLQRAYDVLRAKTLEAADVVLPVSSFSAELLRRRVTPHARATVVPNGVDARRLSGGDGADFRARHGLASAPLLLSVGRLVSRKGVDSVLQCLPSLVREVPGMRYLVVGHGPDAARLHALADQLGVRESVRFLGRLDDAELSACYAASDAVVLAARDEADSVEGFGLVLLEASACGRPTIGTLAGGMSDAVQDGVTGLLVPPNDPAALGAAIVRLLTTPTLARALGEAGRLHASSEGSWERTADRILQTLEGDRTRSPAPTGRS